MPGLKLPQEDLRSVSDARNISQESIEESSISSIPEENSSVPEIIRQVAHVSVSDFAPFTAANSPDPWIGQHLGQYEVLARIGKGGMGVVYKARHTRLQRKVVALKVLSEKHAQNVVRRRLLEREAQLAHAVRHPNIAEIHDIGEEGGTTFVVMEYVEGQRLGALVETKKVPISKMLHYAEQFAAGLAAAHKERIVHRDLSPNNVMITGDGIVKILDFGLSKLLLDDETQPSVSTTAAVNACPASTITVGGGGTPGYMSPEQARGAAVDSRTDIYSFGILLKELIAAAPDHNTQIEKAALSVAARCVQEDPANRFANGSELFDALHAIQLRIQGTKKRKLVIGFSAAAVVVGLGVLLLKAAASDTFVHVKGRSRPGCAADKGVILKASAYMPTPESPMLRFYITRDDDSPWLTPGKLTVFVGDGPTCAQKPFNVPKIAGDVVLGNKIQTLELPVRPYDGAWSIGEEKQFWVGFEENGWLAYRASGPVVMQHIKYP